MCILRGLRGRDAARGAVPRRSGPKQARNPPAQHIPRRCGARVKRACALAIVDADPARRTFCMCARRRRDMMSETSCLYMPPTREQALAGRGTDHTKVSLSLSRMMLTEIHGQHEYGKKNNVHVPRLEIFQGDGLKNWNRLLCICAPAPLPFLLLPPPLATSPSRLAVVVCFWGDEGAERVREWTTRKRLESLCREVTSCLSSLSSCSLSASAPSLRRFLCVAATERAAAPADSACSTSALSSATLEARPRPRTPSGVE